MKILWIADMNTSIHQGGSQQTNKAMIDYGRSLGITVDELNYGNMSIKITSDTKNQYDFIISNNVYLFSKIPGFLDWLDQLPNHIRYEHDANSYLTQRDRAKLFRNAKLSLFLSEEHLQYFQDVYGQLFKDIPTAIATPHIDQTLFYNYNIQRSDSLLWCGLLHMLKGLNSLQKYANAGNSITISAIGNFSLIADLIKLPNVRLVGQTPYEQMPILYNQHKTLLYHPGQLEPFCRTVGEALLCGMEINTDNSQYKIGALELYNRVGLEQFQHICNNAGAVFWDAINVLGGYK